MIFSRFRLSLRPLGGILAPLKLLRSRFPDAAIRLLVVAILLVGGIVTLRSMLPAALKDRGLQRAAAIEREKAKPIHYVGATMCAACHADQFNMKSAGYHRNLSCETCHGPGSKHVENPGEVKPPAPRDRKFCPTCHTYNPSRPMGFPQINPITHNPVEPCITCHNPHDPKPPETPRECLACHGEIARMKAVSPHALLECTTCHTTPENHKLTPLLVKPSKPANREFCGKCHDKDSKVAKAPKVDVASHGERYLCWQCHYPHMPEVE